MSIKEIIDTNPNIQLVISAADLKDKKDCLTITGQAHSKTSPIIHP